MEYEPWEIWNGGECPCPGELVQVQLVDETRKDAEKGNPLLAEDWFWGRSEPEEQGQYIIAFRRVKKPETVTRYVAMWQLLGGDVHATRDKRMGDTHRLIFEIDNGEPVNPRFERIE